MPPEQEHDLERLFAQEPQMTMAAVVDGLTEGEVQQLLPPGSRNTTLEAPVVYVRRTGIQDILAEVKERTADAMELASRGKIGDTEELPILPDTRSEIARAAQVALINRITPDKSPDTHHDKIQHDAKGHAVAVVQYQDTGVAPITSTDPNPVTYRFYVRTTSLIAQQGRAPKAEFPEREAMGENPVVGVGHPAQIILRREFLGSAQPAERLMPAAGMPPATQPIPA